MITIYGASDDLIEIEGDINEEFNVPDEICYLILSNGVLLEIEYDIDGIWRIKNLFKNKNDGVIITQCTSNDNDEDYTDSAIIDAEIKWVMLCEKSNVEFRKKK